MYSVLVKGAPNFQNNITNTLLVYQYMAMP